MVTRWGGQAITRACRSSENRSTRGRRHFRCGQLRRRRQRLRRTGAAGARQAQHLAGGGQRGIRHGGMALGGGMNGAAIDRGEYAPDGVVQVARLQQGRQPFRVGHRREIAVVGRADPARARCIGAEFARRISAGHRVGRAFRQAALEGLALAAKSIPGRKRDRRRRARTRRARQTPPGGRRRKSCARLQDRGSTCRLRSVASALMLGQKALRDEVHGLAQPLAVGAERRMHVEAVASAGAGRVGGGKRRDCRTDT